MTVFCFAFGDSGRLVTVGKFRGLAGQTRKSKDPAKFRDRGNSGTTAKMVVVLGHSSRFGSIDLRFLNRVVGTSRAVIKQRRHLHRESVPITRRLFGGLPKAIHTSAGNLRSSGSVT
jgi:hypothetical protein